jgi:hypothetical protein
VKPFRTIYSKKNPKNVYLIGYLPHPTMSTSEWNKRIGLNDTLDKCNYNPAHVAVNESGTIQHSVNGGQVVKFPEETARCPEVFCNNLRSSIQISIDYPNASREITSNWCGKTKRYIGICLYKEYFSQEQIDGVKETLEREFNITIKFTKARGRNSNEYYRFSSISW